MKRGVKVTDAKMEIKAGVLPEETEDPGQVALKIYDKNEEVGHATGYFGKVGTLVGFLNDQYAHGLAGIVDLEEEGPVGVLYGIEVAESHRRRGIGRMLVEEMIRHFESTGVRRVFVQASAQYEDMSEKSLAKFYESAGFEFCCRTEDAVDDPVFYKDL